MDEGVGQNQPTFSTAGQAVWVEVYHEAAQDDSLHRFPDHNRLVVDIAGHPTLPVRAHIEVVGL
jgi:hypothetical protein